MHLWGIHVNALICTATRRWQSRSVIGNKSTSNFKEDFNAIDEEKDDDDEKKDCVSAIEDAVKEVLIVEKFRW